ncbi:MAG TPA: ABC transporter permease [Candidatus Dormibacteraeota bacterium]|jgi:putative spermidine/putrescine transport system permease protein
MAQTVLGTGAGLSIPPPSPVRRLAHRVGLFLYRFPGARLALLLGPVLLWMLVIYLGSLALLFITSFWRQDSISGAIVQDWTLQNFRFLIQESVYRTIAIRTVGIALAVTLTDIVLAIPLAYFAARIATPRIRTFLLLSMVLPLWSSYLVRVYAWRTILSGDGVLNWTLHQAHLGSVNLGFSRWSLWIVFCYLWLPFVVLPVYAALERIPTSLIEASTDLGARWWTTFRRVILPIAWPGIVAGSIFAFSLTLGDYIAPELVGDTEFIGNVIYQAVGIANNIPFAAAYAVVPALIMGIYLVVARRMKAFEAL